MFFSCNFILLFLSLSDTHMYCLDPPLEEIPDDDWYCPLCKNDESEIIGKGQMVKYG